MNGKVAVISGGAGRIGFEILRRFCESGMHVAVFGSSKEKALETVDRLGAWGGNCLPIECNVMEVNSVRLAMAQTNDRFGGVDVVIALQGWPSKKTKITEITDEYWNGVVSSHLTGSFHMLQQAIPYLRKSSAPRVVFMASHGARTGEGSDEGLAYTAAKGGIVSMTYYAAKMLAKRGITVNCIATGGIYNNYEQEEDEVELIERIPLGRLGTPEEVAAAVWYLVSEEAGFVTGEVLNVNGGLSVG